MKYNYSIYNADDFEKLSRINFKESNITDLYIELMNDITFMKEFTPINLEGVSVIFNGNKHSLNNINIYNLKDEKEVNDYTGMFTKADNLHIYNLNVDKSYIYGGQISGTIVGKVEDTFRVENCNFERLNVNCEALCGGLAGVANYTYISDTHVESKVYGTDVVGGLVGMAKRYVEYDSYNESYILGIGKCLDEKVGYTDRKMIKELK